MHIYVRMGHVGFYCAGIEFKRTTEGDSLRIINNDVLPGPPERTRADVEIRCDDRVFMRLLDVEAWQEGRSDTDIIVVPRDRSHFYGGGGDDD